MQITFGCYWEEYGRATFTVPDAIDPDDKDAIFAYLKDHIDDIGLPSGEYVQDSFGIDEQSPLEVHPTGSAPIQYAGFPGDGGSALYRVFDSPSHAVEGFRQFFGRLGTSVSSVWTCASCGIPCKCIWENGKFA